MATRRVSPSIQKPAYAPPSVLSSCRPNDPASSAPNPGAAAAGPAAAPDIAVASSAAASRYFDDECISPPPEGLSRRADRLPVEVGYARAAAKDTLQRGSKKQARSSP